MWNLSICTTNNEGAEVSRCCQSSLFWRCIRRLGCALQCLSVSLCGSYESFVLASSSSQPQPRIKTSSLLELFWIKFQRTAQAFRLLGSQASEHCSPSTCNFTSSLKKLLQIFHFSENCCVRIQLPCANLTLHQRAHHLTWIKALIQQ
ncbi:hypothetical protein ATANTOWER_024433 [Ataeniobius toweri]|uniref:Uncharacterized protein n=1 Tax=Ataeniobius toweri TaxID=208326 RepID=A0ABU7BUB5_9TELE|nr:hypothetical protein [Ataeniobius toweri]